MTFLSLQYESMPQRCEQLQLFLTASDFVLLFFNYPEASMSIGYVR